MVKKVMHTKSVELKVNYLGSFEYMVHDVNKYRWSGSKVRSVRKEQDIVEESTLEVVVDCVGL